MIQIKDVAKLAGVSTGSVSKVLNGYENVSRKMRNKVEKAIKELDYKPNMVARSLRTKTNKQIAIMVPSTNDPYFVEFFRGLSICLQNIGYVSMLYSIEDKSVAPESLREIFMRGIDGLIASTYGWKEDFLEEIFMISERIPVVSFKRTFPNTKIHSVNIDDHEGMFKAVNHLITLGHRRIAYIAAGLHLETGQQRLNGYKDAIEQAGILFDQSLVITGGNFSIESGYKFAKQIIDSSLKPTAIIGANDSISMGALKYLEASQIQVPADIAVMGYDDLPFSTLVSPMLSSVSIPVYDMAERCVQILDSVIRGECKETVNELFPTQLVVRKSTDIHANSEFEFARFSK